MGAALITLIGVWVTHTAEYARVSGLSAVWHALPASVHLYMLPAAGVLGIVTARGAGRVWRSWTAMGWRLERTRAGIAAAWRGRRLAAPPPAETLPPFSCRLVALWLPLAVVQAALYVVQENVEARWTGQGAAGLGPVTGVHAAAPLVDLVVALLLAVGASALLGLFRRRAHVVAASERLLRALLMAVAPRAASPCPRRAWTPSPVDRFGTHILPRPPPAPSAG